MIKIFRQFRQNFLKNNKTTTYLKYAVGEILLVVIGILIALAINNWNEYRKAVKTEKFILNSFISAIDEDLRIYNLTFERRLNIKKNALDSLMKFIGSKMTVHDSTLMKYYRRLGNDIVGRFDSGPYDALKSNGLNQISNDALRKEIVNTYQVVMPAFLKFMELPELEYKNLITELENELFISKVVKNDNDEWGIENIPRNSNIISDSRLVKILQMEHAKYSNYIRRLDSMKNILSDLRLQIEEELKKR